MSSFSLAPDRAAILLHLDFLASRASSLHSNLQVEIAWGGPDAGPNRARLFALSERTAAVEFASSVNRTGCNVYVGATLKKPDAPNDRRTSNRHAAIATCVAIDIDRDFVASARKLPFRPQLLVLTGGTPSARGHLWIGIGATVDLAMWEEATSRAVALCGGDMGARGRARVMRLGGTISYPPSTKQARGYVLEPVKAIPISAPTYDIVEMATLLGSVGDGVRSKFTNSNADNRTRHKPTANPLDVKAAIACLPYRYADNHDLWLRTGFALHSFDPGNLGLALWIQFSKRCPEKAALTDFERRWASFGRPGQRPTITTRWLFAQAREHGWKSRGELDHRSGKLFSAAVGG